jgi:hypothetical protein
MKYCSTRWLIALLISIPEMWLYFWCWSRSWFEIWAQNALAVQLLLISAALITWALRGEGEDERRKEEKWAQEDRKRR